LRLATNGAIAALIGIRIDARHRKSNRPAMAGTFQLHDVASLAPFTGNDALFVLAALFTGIFGRRIVQELAEVLVFALWAVVGGRRPGLLVGIFFRATTRSGSRRTRRLAVMVRGWHCLLL